jgi:imidazolonepropionase-like amidohydrolase
MCVPRWHRRRLAQNQATVIRGASAFDGRGRVIPNATIVVRDGKIASVDSGGAATRHV